MEILFMTFPHKTFQCLLMHFLYEPSSSPILQGPTPSCPSALCSYVTSNRSPPTTLFELASLPLALLSPSRALLFLWYLPLCDLLHVCLSVCRLSSFARPVLLSLKTHVKLSILLCVSVVHSFSLLCSIPLYVYPFTTGRSSRLFLVWGNYQ